MKHLRRCVVGAVLGLGLFYDSVCGGAPPNTGVKGRKPVLIAKRKPKENATRHEQPHVHVNATLRDGAEGWNVVASPSGRFPVVVNHESEVLLVNLNVPHVRPGRVARVTLNNHGWLAPATTRVGPLPRSRRIVGRWLAAQRVNTPRAREQKIDVDAWAGTRSLNVRVAADRMIAFHYHYGENKHAQQIEVNVAGRRYRFEVHLHRPRAAAH